MIHGILRCRVFAATILQCRPLSFLRGSDTRIRRGLDSYRSGRSRIRHYVFCRRYSNGYDLAIALDAKDKRSVEIHTSRFAYLAGYATLDYCLVTFDLYFLREGGLVTEGPFVDAPYITEFNMGLGFNYFSNARIAWILLKNKFHGYGTSLRGKLGIEMPAFINLCLEDQDNLPGIAGPGGKSPVDVVINIGA